MYASASQKSESMASAVARQRERADPPAIGPANDTRAFTQGSKRHVPERDVGAEERQEDGQLRIEPLALRLEVVAELVDEDQEHEADRERPPPDQRVPADRDEDPEELQDDEAELRDRRDHDEQRRQEAAQERAARPVMLAGQGRRLRCGDGLGSRSRGSLILVSTPPTGLDLGARSGIHSRVAPLTGAAERRGRRGS